MKRLRIFIVPVVCAFALGVLVRDQTQEWRDKKQAEQLAAQVRGCPQYVVVSPAGKFECRAMMNRIDFVWPVPNKHPDRKILANRSSK